MTATPIPILDLGPEISEHWEAYNEAFQRVLRSGRFIGGPEVQSFESEAAEYLGVEHAVGLNSGTDALVIALRALGIEDGDEVITTPFTFFATAEAISQVGARPVFVDVDERTYNIDPGGIEAAITERTRALLPVHLYGQPAPMAPIMGIAQRNGLRVIEDCAQCFGACYAGESPGDGSGNRQLDGRTTGSIGDIGTYSFFPSKTLGAFGDGGMLTTNDSALAELAVKLRGHGGAHKYHNEMLGYNSRLDALQAAMLRIKLRHLDAGNDARREVAQRYTDALEDVDGVIVPEMAEGHVFHQYTIRILNGRRNAVANALEAQGIHTMVYYPIPVHRLPVYAGESWPSQPVAERLATEVLSLPMGPRLEIESQQRVIDALSSAL